MTVPLGSVLTCDMGDRHTSAAYIDLGFDLNIEILIVNIYMHGYVQIKYEIC